MHIPSETYNPIYDYIFLGSSNYDKIERYNLFFASVVKKFNGLIAGPGWDWSKNYVYSFLRDREIYSFSKVAINLHLETQIKLKRQLNERAYIIAAFGIPQVTDNAAIIPSEFPRIGLIANSSFEFNDSIRMILNDKKLGYQLSMNAIEDVYKYHTTFHRCLKLVSDLKSLAND
jgi:spore maturation protein CgeB